MRFFDKLDAAVTRNRSLLCIGLDTDPARMPPGITVADFNRAIIDATADLVCAYKPNLAFYEALGEAGMEALRQTLEHIPADVPTIADAKRNDIGNTAAAYATAIFTNLGFDAMTVSPYLGFDSVAAYAAYEDKGVFVLCRTSNPGAADFQDLACRYGDETLPLYQVVARKVDEWNTAGNLGLVVGATYPEELGVIRASHPEMTFLVPGIGAQGGDLAQAVANGADTRGRGMVINSSRQILYASTGKDFAAAARQAASQLRDNINRHLPASSG